LFEDFPEVLTPGRYCFCPDGTPHYPSLHPYGSREWTTDDAVGIPLIGEDEETKHGLSNGLAPYPFPLALDLGKVSKCGQPADWYWLVGGSTVTNPQPTHTLDIPLSTVDLPGGTTCGGAFDPPTTRLVAFLNFTTDFDGQLVTVRIHGVAPNDSPIVFGAGLSAPGQAIHFDSDGFGGPCSTVAYDLSQTWEFSHGFHQITLEVDHHPFSNSAAGNLLIEITKQPAFRPSPVRLQDGFDVRCFPGKDLPPPPFFPDVQVRDHQLAFAKIIDLLYSDTAAAIADAQSFLGIDAILSVVPNSTILGSGTIVAILPGGTVAMATGTTDFEQLALQVLYGVAGGVDIGSWTTNLIWQTAADTFAAAIAAAGPDVTRPVILVGHSLGGAMAALVAASYANFTPSRPISLLTYGCPRVGDIRLKNALVPVRRVWMANRGDPVPAVPPHRGELQAFFPILPALAVANWNVFETNSGQVIIDSDGATTEDDTTPTTLGTIGTILLAALANNPFPTFANHDLAEYVARLSISA